MLTKKPTSLPIALTYLQPFVNALAKLPADELNEDVDASRLDAALRKRVRGLDVETARLRLNSDRGELERWLKFESAHPAAWVLGYLSLPDIAEHLIKPLEPIDPGPEIRIELPDGWKLVRKIPFRVDFRKGKVHGSVTALEKLNFEHLRQYEQRKSSQINVPGFEASPIKFAFESTSVVFGPCSGSKNISHLAAPTPFKQVTYMLSVPNGYVSVWLGTLKGTDFDEAPVENKLHTLGLLPTK